MSELVVSTSPVAPPQVLPTARVAVRVRAGTMDDLPFIDALQKKHHKQLAFFNKPTLEGKIRLGHVLVACAARACSSDSMQDIGGPPMPLAGYLIGNDRYKHRDELGVIFQLCVAAEYRRSLVAAHLLRAQFDRSAYGCRLYCCWCAQDIEGNRFWENMGFVPIAYRAGGEKKNRRHIFWQKRIREGDVTTPWWFPSETRGGLMDAARIALPIPPGMRWDDELPVLHLADGPGEQVEAEALALPGHGDRPNGTHGKAAGAKEAGVKAVGAMKATGLSGALWFKRPTPRMPVQFGRPGAVVAAGPGAVPTAATGVATRVQGDEKPVKPRRIKKANPAVAAAARELRDRWMEQFNAAPPMLSAGKYDVCRLVDGRRAAESTEATTIDVRPVLALAA